MKANAPAPCLALCLGLALASCATPPPPAPAPPPPPAPVAIRAEPAAPPPPADWRDAPATPGDWHWSREGALSVARFGLGATVQFRMVCDPAARTLTLQRTTRSIDPNPVPLAITTGTQRRVLDARASSAGDDPVLSASLTVSDPLLDAMAFSRGRFMIETPGAAPLYLPSWAEVSRVIEDCR